MIIPEINSILIVNIQIITDQEIGKTSRDSGEAMGFIFAVY